MEQRLKEYVHIVPSWDAYPRVRYFYNNLKCLVPRFKRVAGALPLCFHNKQLNEQLDEVLEAFDNGIQVTVFGDDDMDRKKFVISTNGQETDNRMIKPSIDVYICNVKVHGISPSSVMEVWTLLDQVINRGVYINPNVLFLYCEIATSLPTGDVENFKSEILKQLQDHDIQLESTHIIVGPHMGNIAEKISDVMETKVINSFCEINNHLDQFIPKMRYTPCEMNLDETEVKEQISKQLKMILNKYTLNDLAETGDELKNEPQTEKDKNGNIVSAIPRVIKCLLVSILAVKFNISATLCNDLICHQNFETRLSNELNQDLMETKMTGDDMVGMMLKALPELLPEIRKDFEETRSVMGQMRKMKLEVHGYLKQTKVPHGCNPLPTPPKLPEELRKEIRSTEGVYGFGTFYGQVEIHIEKSDKLPTEENIRALMKKYRFSHPYSIKHVCKRPTLMSFDLEPGNELFARIPQFRDREPPRGTLGGYIKDKTRKVYGLTCAHVVGQTGNAQVFGYKNKRPHPFSKNQYIFYGGSRTDDNFTFVDIAAAEIIKTLQNDCKQYLEDNQSPIKVAEVHDDILEDLVGTKVFKIGAFTGKTRGIIGSVDYELFSARDGEYLMTIDIMTGDESDVETNMPPNDSHRGGDSTHTGTSGLQFLEVCFTEQSGPDNIDCEQLINERCSGPKKDFRGSPEFLDSGAPDDVDARENNLRIYIHDPYLWTGRSTNGVFSNRGDSGSIVCRTTLSDHETNFTGLSMISAGDFTTTDGLSESKDTSLAFKLHVGLERLHEHYHIDW